MSSSVSEGWSMIWVLVPLVDMAIASKASEPATPPTTSDGSPAFTLPVLPYAQELGFRSVAVEVTSLDLTRMRGKKSSSIVRTT